jgi:hypothetical protein
MMRIVEHDGKDETGNQSIRPSKYTINIPDKHAHGRDMSDQEPKIRQWFCNTPCILVIAKERQLDWIRKVVCMEETKIQ